MTWESRASIGLSATDYYKDHTVRVYEDRLAISRLDGKNVSWEEAQELKERYWPNSIAVEVFPPEGAVVNLRATRHLWRSPLLSEAVCEDCIHPEFNKENFDD
jgi:hypothetical protein